MKTIYHEAPNAIFHAVQSKTGGDYALVHMFEENEVYFNLFKQAVEKNRTVILDNSIFELGKAFSADKFTPWIEKLNPTYYIIPDELEDAETTVANAKAWSYDHPAKKIGVVQGKTYEEIVWCYQEVEQLVDMVAISFDYSLYQEWFPNEKTKYHSWVQGRRKLIQMLQADDVINTNKPHHLLGCGLPQEFSAYQSHDWIVSIDTSNPVVAGIKGLVYNGTSGLEDKPSEKLYTLIGSKPDPVQYQNIMNNIYWFDRIVNG